MTTFVAVYHDEGTGPFSRGCLSHALATAFADRGQVRRIDADEIRTSDSWHANTSVLAFPGGADLPYAARLNGAGNASIRRYLEAGGAFLGVCAGAYYAAARVAWEAGSPDATAGTRELALFEGTARGSLHDLAAPYSLDHVRCTAVTRVCVPGERSDLRALYWGGPEFVPDPGARYRPLLEYAGTRRLAAVRVEVGRGRAVLAGVHAEITGEQFPAEVSRYGDDSFDHGMQVSAELARFEAERRAVWARLLAAL